MVFGQSTEFPETTATELIVVGPSGGQRRNRMIVRREFDAQIVGVADVQEPSSADAKGDSAVPDRMAEQGD